MDNPLSIATFVLGLFGTALAILELILLPRKYRQDILDRLKPPPASQLTPFDSPEDEINALANSGMDLAEVNATFAVPPWQLARALRSLYKRGKIDIAVLHGTTDDSHQQIPQGSRAIVPIIIRGLAPPQHRATRAIADSVFTALSKSFSAPPAR